MALRIVIGDVTIGIHGQDFPIFSPWAPEAWSLYIRMAKSGCIGLPDRLSGAQSRIMTEGVDSHSAVQYGLPQIVLYAAVG